MRNARFWIYENGDHVKLTLRPGQALNHAQGGPTDEGWFREAETFTYDAEAGLVRLERVNDGADCDGRLTHYAELECPLDRLGALTLNECPPMPDWQRVGASQRDYAAEAMGY